jgi:hypothetical protein
MTVSLMVVMPLLGWFCCHFQVVDFFPGGPPFLRKNISFFFKKIARYST